MLEDDKNNKVTVIRHRKSFMLTEAMDVVPYDFLAYDFDNDNFEDDDHTIDAVSKKAAAKKASATQAAKENYVPPAQSNEVSSASSTADLHEEPEMVGYSEAEMQIVKQRAHEDGYQLAKHEAEQSLEKALLEKLSQLPLFIERMQEQQNEYLAQSEGKIISLVTMMMRKLFPAYMRTHGINEIKHIVEESLPMLAHQHKLTITCHHDAQNIIAPMIDELTNAAHIDININYLHDDNMMFGDVALDWDSGGIENNMAATLDYMINAANKTIAQLDELANNPPTSDDDAKKQENIIQENTIEHSEQHPITDDVNTAHDDPMVNQELAEIEEFEQLPETVEDSPPSAETINEDDNVFTDQEAKDLMDDEFTDDIMDNINEEIPQSDINHDDLPEDLDTDAL